MIVIAQEKGFYNGCRYRKGDEIEWNIRDKPGRWVKVKDPLAQPPEPEPEPPLPDWKKMNPPSEYPPQNKFAEPRKPAENILKKVVKTITGGKKAKK